ncbi:hypothetical protein [uncultured Litoreibacter sp.]|uniref:hypothetical protein n=1 Tax=uncultured Litoreibacter sp. TaxID=1392394 RepID=UPI002607BF05|nr:hypothetical protein [uncultured Litoreibacter sp.]
MAISLKDLNRPALVLVIIANFAIYSAFLAPTLNFGSMVALLKDYENLLPGALVALIVGVLNSQLSHEIKARLVFWRWLHPLPGSFAFTKVAKRDTRIDPDALEAAYGPLPTEPAQQNRLWFKWYREYQNEVGISQVHREYLFTRDWAGLSVLLAVALTPLAFWQMTDSRAWLLAAFLVLQYFLVRRSAKNHGERFVASVLANKSASI